LVTPRESSDSPPSAKTCRYKNKIIKIFSFRDLTFISFGGLIIWGRFSEPGS
jgi:hypothetical protein